MDERTQGLIDISDTGSILVYHLYDDIRLIRAIPKHTFVSELSAFEYPIAELPLVLKTFTADGHAYETTDAVADKLLELEEERHRNEQAFTDFDKRGLDSGEEFNPLLKAHQKKVLHIIKTNSIDRMALFMDTGTGKTFTMLEIIKLLNPKRALVVCPLSLVRSVWLNESAKWHPELDVRSIWDPRANAKSLSALKTIIKREGQVNVITFATFRNIADTVVAMQKSDNPPYDMLIVDESSIMKDYTSKTTKALLAFGETVKQCFILSGCPAPNGPDEYFAQMMLVNPDILGRSHGAFVSTWFQTGWGGKATITTKRLTELMAEISRQAIFIKKEDCLDLPEHSIIVRDVMMEPKQEETYKQLRDQLASKLDDSFAVVPKNFLAKLMKLRQVTSGFVKPTDLLEDDDTTTINDIEELDAILKHLGIRADMGNGATPAKSIDQVFNLSDGKCQEIIDILTTELAHEQLIIWCQFTHEFDKLSGFLTKAGITHQAMHGATPKWKIDEIEESFKSGATRVLIAHPRSVAHGHTWTHCSYDIVMSSSYSFEEWKQSKDRIHRMGQTKPCTRIVLASVTGDGEKTIDHMLLSVVEDKRNLDEVATQFLRGSWR